MPSGPGAPRQIVFAIDRAYAPPLAAALESFLAHHDPARYRVAILHKALRPRDEARLDGYFGGRGLALEFMRIDRDFSGLPVGYHFNEVIFYRLLIPELFPGIARALYLDADILFLAPVDELFALDLGDRDLAAVPTHGVAGVPPHLRGELDRYYASGLLLMNLARFRAGNYTARMLEFLRTRRYEMPDQDALNFVARDFLELPARYGFETAFFARQAEDEALRREGEAAKIIQFSTHEKPWHFGIPHPYRRAFYRHLRNTPYRFTPPARVGRYFRRAAGRALRRLLPAAWFERLRAALRGP